MSDSGNMTNAVQRLEALMLEKFRNEPFHNLRLMYGPKIAAAVPGGTCSDKTQSFIAAATEAGFDVSLHSGFIDGREIHRLARVRIDGRICFADIGNGWPALRIYPADAEMSFRCFGMEFRTEIGVGRVRIFLSKLERESQQLEIMTRCRPEAEIQAEIERRFTSGIVYPFSNSIRFSQVIGNRFLFLRGSRLEIHSETGFESIDGIEAPQVPLVIREHFGFDIQPYLGDGAVRSSGDRG